MNKDNFKFLIKLGPIEMKSFRESFRDLFSRYFTNCSVIILSFEILFGILNRFYGNGSEITTFSFTAVGFGIYAFGYLVFLISISVWAQKFAYRWFGFDEKGMWVLDSRNWTGHFIDYSKIRSLRNIQKEAVILTVKKNGDNSPFDWLVPYFLGFSDEIARLDFEKFILGKCSWLKTTLN